MNTVPFSLLIGPLAQGQGRKAHCPKCRCRVGMKYLYKFQKQILCESCGWAEIRRWRHETFGELEPQLKVSDTKEELPNASQVL